MDIQTWRGTTKLKLYVFTSSSQYNAFTMRFDAIRCAVMRICCHFPQKISYKLCSLVEINWWLPVYTLCIRPGTWERLSTQDTYMVHESTIANHVSHTNDRMENAAFNITMLCILYHFLLRKWYTLEHIVFFLISIFWFHSSNSYLIFDLCATSIWSF